MDVTDRSIEYLIGSHIVPQADGCWLYNGDPDNYVHRTNKRNGENLVIHRFVFETLVGPIPDGHHLHHRCENPGCCNPEHLVPLTPKEHSAAHRA